MKWLLTIAFLFASALAAHAQNIDYVGRAGASGTHISLELPISSYSYEGDTYCTYTYSHSFKVYHNGVQKISELYTIVPTASPTAFVRNVSFSGWNLAVGDVVLFYSFVKILSGPYRGQNDTDNLYGDVVDNIAFLPRSSGDAPHEDAIPGRRRRVSWSVA